MNLYLVKNLAGVPVWVAFESDQDDLYTFVQNTGKFHLNAGLGHDFYFDQTMTFEPIDQQAAEAAIMSGVGRRDEGSCGPIIARNRRDRDALSPATVFGAVRDSLATDDNDRPAKKGDA